MSSDNGRLDLAAVCNAFDRWCHTVWASDEPFRVVPHVRPVEIVDEPGSCAFYGLEAHFNDPDHPEWWQIKFRSHGDYEAWPYEGDCEFRGNRPAMELDMMGLLMSEFDQSTL